MHSFAKGGQLTSRVPSFCSFGSCAELSCVVRDSVAVLFTYKHLFVFGCCAALCCAMPCCCCALFHFVVLCVPVKYCITHLLCYAVVLRHAEPYSGSSGLLAHCLLISPAKPTRPNLASNSSQSTTPMVVCSCSRSHNSKVTVAAKRGSLNIVMITCS